MPLNRYTVNKSTNGLGRTAPDSSKVYGLVTTGVAVVNKLVLGAINKLKSTADAKRLGLDAAYDNANNVLVYHHIDRFFMREPNAELHLLVADQAQGLTDLVDKSKPYAKKLLASAGGKIRYCGISANHLGNYVAVLHDGLDADVLTAVPKAQELYDDEAKYLRYSSFLIEGKQFNGLPSAAHDLRSMTYPNASITILADPAISAIKAAYRYYAAIGDVLGLKAHGALSQNFGELVEEFNLVNEANGAFASCGLSSGLDISTYSDTDLDTLDQKGYIFGTSVPIIDGLYINDTHTCSPISENDYAYIEANSVTEEAIRLANALMIRKLKARLPVDKATGLLLPEIKAALENDIKKALSPLEKAGDISGGIDAQIPDEYQDDEGVTQVQNLLAQSKLFFEVTFVPDAIGRAITMRIGMTNPNKR